METPSRPRREHTLTDFAFSPSGDRVACATTGGLELRTWPGLTLVRAWTASSGARRKVRFHPGGRRMAVTFLDAPLVVLDLDGGAATEIGGGPYDAIAYDVEGTLFAHDREGVLGFLEGDTQGMRATTHTRRGQAWIWDTLLLPRRRKTIYGQNDADAWILDWSTGAVVDLRRWTAPHTPRGASIFALAANGDETCLAFGGKHPYVNVARLGRRDEVLSCEQLWFGRRCVGVACHPREDVLAALSLGGRLAFLDARTGAKVRPPYEGYGGDYPAHGA